MTSEEAFQLISESVCSSSDMELISRYFDEENFGNFLIGIRHAHRERSILCDRGQILLCDGLAGADKCRLAVPTLHDVSEASLLHALELG